jgi:F-type H+-transporting ATPase subunit delta
MPLTPATTEKVVAWLDKRYGTYTVTYHIDESLLGGIVIFDGEQVFDGSVKSKLKGLHLT